MKIQTFSIVAGSEACNARCPFCISKMTVPNGVELREPEVNWHNFHKACRLAQMASCTTAMLTGKGEPTLFPVQITKYLSVLGLYNFPIIELQTNGIPISNKRIPYEVLKEWHEAGLSTIAISIVHWEPEKNRTIYTPYAKKYIDLPELIGTLHGLGFSVRLACVMLKGYIETPGDVQMLAEVAKANKVEQLTIRAVDKPGFERSQNPQAYNWTAEHSLSEEQKHEIQRWLERNGKYLMPLMHGGKVFDLNGQNVCYTGCLTTDADSGDIRQLIFFPDGHLRYDWQYEGAIIL